MVRSTVSTLIPKKLQLPNILLHQSRATLRAGADLSKDWNHWFTRCALISQSPPSDRGVPAALTPPQSAHRPITTSDACLVVVSHSGGARQEEEGQGGRLWWQE